MDEDNIQEIINRGIVTAHQEGFDAGIKAGMLLSIRALERMANNETNPYQPTQSVDKE